MKIAFTFLLSMPGAPFIYYGDEIGLRYVEGLTSVEGGYGRTGSRSPMQWNKTPNAGFSSAPAEKLYVRQDDAPDRPDAASQCADEASLRSEVKRPHCPAYGASRPTEQGNRFLPCRQLSPCLRTKQRRGKHFSDYQSLCSTCGSVRRGAVRP